MTTRKKEMSTEEREFYKAVGLRLTRQREKAGMTQIAVANALHVVQQTYAAYESGRNRLPLFLVPVLEKLLCTDAGYLIGSAISPKAGRKKRR